MFCENKKHLQQTLFPIDNQLSPKKQKKLHESWESYFYNLIFCRINEKDFAVLYSEKGSRPNAAVNCLVSGLILMNRNGWSYEELFDQIDFNLKTRTAFGLVDLTETPFCSATIFNFQNSLTNYFIKTGINLLEEVFDNLTEGQLKTLKLKSNIQRSDSFLAASNIRNYSRLQLLIEVLIRLHRVLSPDDKNSFAEKFSDYVKQSAGQYIYRVRGGNLNHELEKLGQVYHWLYEQLKDNYKEIEIFKVFERAYTEHFTKVEEKLQVKPSEELSSEIMQSPDDLEATYRKKRDDKSHGHSIHFSETAHPDNQLNLITDVAVAPNNRDDSKILNDRLDEMKKKNPEFAELHTDGGYGSEGNDKKMEELNITHIQTAIKGAVAEVPIEIEQIEEGIYEVSCPNQKVISNVGRKKYQAHFSLEICRNCELKENCSTLERKNYRVYSFEHKDYLKKRRQKNIELIPTDRKKIRPNVEATVREFKRVMPNGKLKVRGYFRTCIFAFTKSIGINFGRIYRFKLGDHKGRGEESSKIPFIVQLILYFSLKQIENQTQVDRFLKKRILYSNDLYFLN